MKITLSTRNLTLEQLRDDLRQRFPNYRFHIFGRQLLVTKSLLEGCGVVINSGSVKVGAVPAALGSMAVTAALGAMLLIPGLIFLVILNVRSKPLVKEIGSQIARCVTSRQST